MTHIVIRLKSHPSPIYATFFLDFESSN
jgi:hypothetical protein